MSRFPWPGKRVFVWTFFVLSSPPVKRHSVLILLAAWLTLLLVTHRGPRSPYTYVQEAAGARSRPVTRSAAPDAVTVLPVTRFLYDGSPLDYRTAHNLRLPLHSFAVGTIAAFVRPYLLANDLTNLLFLIVLTAAALQLAARFELDMRATLLALATICALPPIAGYIGQAMHYIVGPAISFLVILAALALDEKDLRNPWIAGLLTTILMLNYDWYVYVAAMAVYFLFVVRFSSLRDAAIYLVVAIVPALGWNLFLDAVSTGSVSTALQTSFVSVVIGDWITFLSNPGRTPLLPLAVTQIGAHIAFHQIIAIIYWPLAVCCAIALWRSRPESSFRGRALLLSLVAFYLLEQLFTAAFDWENNPRRALPVFLAFAFAWCWTVDRHLGRKWWTAAFLALFALTSLIAFADMLLDTPGAASLYMGDAMRKDAKWPLKFQTGSIEVSDALEPALRGSFPRARLSDATMPFAVANAVAGAATIALFWILARARLLPHYAPYVVIAIWIASAIRFVV